MLKKRMLHVRKMDLARLLCCFTLEPRDLKKAAETEELIWREFAYSELAKATSNFSVANKIGEGGFGAVYYGILNNGTQIAVKRLKVWSAKAEAEFAREVEILGQLRHKNLLRLRGYCVKGQERIIVFDYMPNSSLHSHLHGRHSRNCLSWERRMNIAIGSAKGIEYLHLHASPHIIHLDIKSSNILLDSDFQAQVADFGFAKLVPDGATHVTTRVKGTLGYLAPEYAMWGKASESCDIYSFGILLLELVTGKKPIDNLGQDTRCVLAEWAMEGAIKGKYDEIVDPSLAGNYNKDELKLIVDAALACAQTARRKRPTIHDIVCYLSGEVKQLTASPINKNKRDPTLDFQTHEEKTTEADIG